MAPRVSRLRKNSWLKYQRYRETLLKQQRGEKSVEGEAAIRESEGGSEYCIVVRDTLAADGGQGSMVSGGRKAQQRHRLDRVDVSWELTLGV